MTNLYPQVKQALADDRLFALATVLSGTHPGRKMMIWPDGSVDGDLGDAALNEQVQNYARTLLAAQRTEKVDFAVGDQTETVFIEVYSPPPKLIVVGAVHIAMPLVTYANTLGFKTIVVDARAAFATADRFPHVDELIVRWPADAIAEMTLDEATCVVFLTHDEKLDNPALEIVLQHPVQYVGALGSRKTHAKRIEALRLIGLRDEQINRIYAPIGLKLGGRKPEEIAVSIIAEIVSVRNGVGVR